MYQVSTSASALFSQVGTSAGTFNNRAQRNAIWHVSFCVLNLFVCADLSIVGFLFNILYINILVLMQNYLIIKKWLFFF